MFTLFNSYLFFIKVAIKVTISILIAIGKENNFIPFVKDAFVYHIAIGQIAHRYAVVYSKAYITAATEYLCDICVATTYVVLKVFRSERITIHSFMCTEQGIKCGHLSFLYAMVYVGIANQSAFGCIVPSVLGRRTFYNGYFPSSNGEALAAFYYTSIKEHEVYLYLGGVLNNRLFADVKGQRIGGFAQSAVRGRGDSQLNNIFALYKLYPIGIGLMIYAKSLFAAPCAIGVAILYGYFCAFGRLHFEPQRIQLLHTIYRSTFYANGTEIIVIVSRIKCVGGVVIFAIILKQIIIIRMYSEANLHAKRRQLISRSGRCRSHHRRA